LKLTKVIDQSTISHLFLPDLPMAYDSLELSAACLGVSKGLRVGSGVFRPLELELQQLVRRLQTLQAVSENRYLLGIGTGSPGPDPAQKINSLLKRLEELRAAFSSSESIFPETYVATLMEGIAHKVAPKCDGILLNFCTPEHARSVVNRVRKSFAGKLETACYLKAFFSESQEMGKRLAVEEFVKYDSFGQYHKMFEKSGVAEEIASVSRSLGQAGINYPETLRQISPVNPEVPELRSYMDSFREAGITLPCVYPYFANDESFEFKHETIRAIISAAE
jgi:hypothetical protein